MSEDERQDQPGTGGPEQPAGSYDGPGYPTIGARRKHLRRLALLAGGVAVAGGALWAVGKLMVDPPHPAGVPPPPSPPPDAQDDSWLHPNRDPDPPPRLMGEMVAPAPEDIPEPLVVPEDDPALRVKGDLAVPENQPPPPPEVEPVPPEDPRPRLKGKIAMPQPPEEPREPEPPEPPEEPRPPAPGGLRAPNPEPLSRPEPQPDPEPAPKQRRPRLSGRVAVPQPPDPPLDPEEPVGGAGIIGGATGTTGNPDVEGVLEVSLGEEKVQYRDVYLTGATRKGAPFTACIRIDPGDEASYEKVLKKRREILTALAPLAENQDLAANHRAISLVEDIVPEAVIRQAGVLR